ncbi:hypothetical protein BDD12DRAFT_884198 [Trichophaea hybrida]|nr:hypothetical protein BDD12DRAFT_884198 [Trichophaea hybrida]
MLKSRWMTGALGSMQKKAPVMPPNDVERIRAKPRAVTLVNLRQQLQVLEECWDGPKQGQEASAKNLIAKRHRGNCGVQDPREAVGVELRAAIKPERAVGFQTRSLKNAAVATMYTGKDSAQRTYTEETDKLAQENEYIAEVGIGVSVNGKQDYGVVVPPECRVFRREHD